MVLRYEGGSGGQKNQNTALRNMWMIPQVMWSVSQIKMFFQSDQNLVILEMKKNLKDYKLRITREYPHNT
jgi:hypothetical protein